MIRQPIKKKWYVSIAIISVLIILVSYTFISYRQHQKNPQDTTMPTWQQLGHGVVKCFTPDRSHERWIYIDAKASAQRFFLGMALGVLSAMIIGLLMGCFAQIEALFLPILTVMARIPPTAALAVFFVLVGTDTPMYVTMISFGVLPILAQTIYLAIQDVPDELMYKAYTLGASRYEVIWNVIFRHIMPRLIDAVRLQIGPALVYLIAAEMVVSHEGFGYRIRLQSKLLDMSVVYPYLAFLASFGFLMDYAMRILQRISCPWFTKEGRS